MKIVQVVHSFLPRFEGIGNYCYELSKHLVQRGHQVDVITSRLNRKLPIEEVIDGITIHRCPYFGTISTNRVTFLIDKLLKTDADLIHAHSYIFLTSNQAAFAKKFNKRPLLLHLHGGIEAIPPSGNILTHLEYTMMKKIYDITIGKWMFNAADLIASVSKRDIELSRQKFMLDKERFHWIPNAVDLSAFNIPRKDEKVDNTLYVLFIGTLVPRKGIGDLLKIAKYVMEENPKVIFVIIGEGPLKKQVEASIPFIEGEIKVLGKVSPDVLHRWLSKASILVLPSYSEGLPTVCIEALANEVPIVASRIGGVPELVIDGETGYLFPPGDIKQCSEKLLFLLANEQLRRRMGRKGRNLVEKFYTWKKVVKETERVYEQIIES